MKKNLLYAGVALAVFLVVVIGIFVVRSKKNVDIEEEEEPVTELSQSQWPAISLTPTEDPKVPKSLGRFLDFRVQKINVANAKTMDYLLVYTTSDGGQQGVPGTIQLTGSDVQKMLLLGSESSGKFRFDSGVSQGTMTLTFRDGKGKSLGRLVSDFHLQSETQELTPVDASFTYKLEKPAKGVFFATVKTYLEPQGVETVYWKDGYGIYASDGNPHAGAVTN